MHVDLMHMSFCQRITVVWHVWDRVESENHLARFESVHADQFAALVLDAGCFP